MSKYFDGESSMLQYFCVLTFFFLSFCFIQEELDSMAKNYPDRFKIYYVLNQVYFCS